MEERKNTMNWNDAIQQLAETHWKPVNKYDPFENQHFFIDQNLRNAMFSRRKPVAGYRFFHCEDCENYWKEKSRDCESPSDESCPKCGELSHPFNSEKHPEWPVDKSGNLV